MPAASSSRLKKRHARAPSSDIEEDPGPSQRKHQTQEDVDMDEEEPRQSKKSKKDKKRAAKDDSDAEVEEEEEEDVPVPEVSDQPLDKNQAMKIRQMATDWAHTREQVHSYSYGFLREVAASVAEFTEGEKGEKILRMSESCLPSSLLSVASRSGLDGLVESAIVVVVVVVAVVQKKSKRLQATVRAKPGPRIATPQMARTCVFGRSLTHRHSP